MDMPPVLLLAFMLERGYLEGVIHFRAGLLVCELNRGTRG